MENGMVGEWRSVAIMTSILRDTAGVIKLQQNVLASTIDSPSLLDAAKPLLFESP
jgi:hypothetical protein